MSEKFDGWVIRAASGTLIVETFVPSKGIGNETTKCWNKWLELTGNPLMKQDYIEAGYESVKVRLEVVE